MVLLGVGVSLHDTHAKAQVGGGREIRPKSQIPHATRSNSLTPAAASKLRGKLGFYASLLVGKLGRGTTGPLIKRQYRQRGFRLSHELHRDLIRRYSAIGNLEPRTAPPKQLKPVGAHTDAQ